MSKLSKQDKIDIYNNWKNYGYSTERLAKQYSVCGSHLRYLVRLIDRYGTKILDHSYTTYSVEFKQHAINRVLLNQEIAQRESLDLALPNSGMIFNWIRKYKEDGYNVINHKKGRPTHEGQRQT
ncbi:MAG: transposase, partial [Lactobacillus sp.]|nr:transposase [Lactobacillus sp.]